jgi:hypothetical protein
MDWQWAGIVCALSAVGWAVAGLFKLDAFLRAVHLKPADARGWAEGSALYIGAFGGTGAAALALATPAAYAVCGAFWLGIGIARVTWCTLYWQWDRFTLAAAPIEVATGVLGVLPWIAS